jgi:hypothetical protein
MDCLENDFHELERYYRAWLSENRKWLCLYSVFLPPGYGKESTEILISIPADYPASPLGVGNSRVYVPPSLRFYGRELRDIHPGKIPSIRTTKTGSFAWWCYEWVEWDPMRDDLISFMEMVRADLTNPPVI